MRNCQWSKSLSAVSKIVARDDTKADQWAKKEGLKILSHFALIFELILFEKESIQELYSNFDQNLNEFSKKKKTNFFFAAQRSSMACFLIDMSS